MSPHRSQARRRASHRRRSSGSLFIFLLIAGFGILFTTSCTPDSSLSVRGPEKEEDLDDLSFTEEDLVKLRDLETSGSAASAGVDMDEDESAASAMALSAGSAGAASSSPVVLDLSMAATYKAIRSGLGATGEDVYRVTNDFLNVRATANVGAAAVGRLLRGDAMKVLEFPNAGWAKVELSDGTMGYVASRYIGKITSDEKLAGEKKKFANMYYVNFGFVNVRRAPSQGSEKIGEIPGQTIVKPLSIDGGWAKVMVDGKEGYVSMQYMAPFLPSFLVRQEQYTLPILHYRLSQEGIQTALIAHVQRLKQEGKKILTFRDFTDLLLRQEQKDVRLEPNTVLLAISDGTADSVKSTAEALYREGVKATFFLETQSIGIGGITEKNILTMIAQGHDLQSGGHTGEDLRTLTSAQTQLEVAQSRKIIEQYTKKPVNALAYPQGGVNDRVTQVVADAGYLLAVGAVPDKVFTRDQFLRIPSYLITGGMSADDIMKIVQ